MEQIFPLNHEGTQQAVFPTLIRHGGTFRRNP